MKNRDALIVFAKSPRSGNVKTRLEGHLPEEERISLYTSLLESTVEKLRAIPDADTFISYSPPEESGYFSKFGLATFAQSEGDLGERMHKAMEGLFADGYARVVLVGVDIPGLSASIIRKAFELLSGVDVVFGPARDGGYYLVGLRAPKGEIFSNIEWSTDTTLRQSIRKAEAAGLSVAFVDTLSDIDRPDDLKNLFPQ